MKKILNAIPWRWLGAAGAASFVVPWVVYGIAGYIEADSRDSFPGAAAWVQPSPDVWPVSALTTFAAVMLLGWSIDRWRARSKRPPVLPMQHSS